MRRPYFIMFIFSYLIYSCNSSKLGISERRRERDRFLKPYVDSINKFTEGSKAPNFLFNPCFDNNPWYWNGMHEPLSLRELVVKKVKNKNALEVLTKSYVNELSTKCPFKKDSSVLGIIEIPLIDKSFYDLLTYRLEELR